MKNLYFAVACILFAIGFWLASLTSPNRLVPATKDPKPYQDPAISTMRRVSYSGHNIPSDQVIEALKAIGIEKKPILSCRYYAEVDSRWLESFTDQQVARYGRAQTDSFDCVFYVMRFRVQAEEEYDKDIHNEFAGSFVTSARSAAIFQVNYLRDSDVNYAKSKGWDGSSFDSSEAPTAHAITLILTNQGNEFVDPQVGKINLSKEEIASIFLILG